MAATIVQSVSDQSGDALGLTLTQPAAVTAGNLLVFVLCRRGNGDITLDPTVNSATGASRPLTYWGSTVYSNIPTATDGLRIGYRIATGDEKAMYFGATKLQGTYYEIAGAGDASTFEVLSASLQTASGTKSLGSFTIATGLQIGGFNWTGGALDQTVGTSWTQDHQYHDFTTGDSPSSIAMHATANPVVQISGGSYSWGAMAVGIAAAAIDLPACGFSPMLLDVYSCDASGTLTYIDTLCDAFDKSVRIELDGTGSGQFSINRNSAEATAATLGNGADISRLVKVRLPAVSGSVAVFAFWIESGDFNLISSQEAGDETLHFSGRGALAYTDRAIMADHSYMTDPFVGEDPFTNLWRLYAAGTGNKAGQILFRIIREAQSASRVIGSTASHPIPGLTMDFAPAAMAYPLLDSTGATWTTTASTTDFQANVGERVLSVIGRLIGTGGITIQCSPDLVLSGYNSFGTDRSSATFATGKVRFVHAVNIRDGLQRQIRGGRQATHELVAGQGTDIYGHNHLNDTTKPHWETFNTGNSPDVTTLNAIALADLTQMLLRSESLQVPVLVGDDEANGLYLPGPAGTNGHYWVGDTVTVTSGAGDFDVVDVALRVAAITISEPNYAAAVTDLSVITELNSTIIGPQVSGTSGDFGGGSIVSSPGGGGGGTTSPGWWLTVEEQDGTPTVTNVTTIKVSNGSLTDDGSGVVSLDFATPGGDMVPYYIAPGDTFTVPLYKQALFSDIIENDGILVVLGRLNGVD